MALAAAFPGKRSWCYGPALFGEGYVIKALTAAFLGFLALSAPVVAFEVQEQVLQVSYNHNGQDYVYDDTVVPLLPGNTCYNWYVKLAETSTALTLTERLTLPRSIDWGSVASDPNDGIEILESGTVAVSTLPVSTDEFGWITHGWCAAKGDPLGPHTIEVAVDGEALASFAFDVVNPSTYSFPAAPSAPWAMRSANQVW
jgi:hypothetical protein